MKWIEKAEELLELLDERPEDAAFEEERLDWQLRAEVSKYVKAATLKPAGVSKSEAADWPRILDDNPICHWVDQSMMARLAQVDVRTIQRWELKGLPAFGEGRSKRYPLPHAVVWHMAYRSLQARSRKGVDSLSVGRAFGEYEASNARLADSSRR